MDNPHEDPPSRADDEVEYELRQARKFSPQEALARMAGSGAMKGASPVSRVQQAEMEIGAWLSNHVADPPRALQIVIHRHLKGSRSLLNNLERPLVCLVEFCDRILMSDILLEELVREADVEWGRLMNERPYFDKTGTASDPDDPYTAVSVRKALTGLTTSLASGLQIHATADRS